MAFREGRLTADGNTGWFEVRGSIDSGATDVHLTCNGGFGAGTITVQQLLQGTAYSALDSADAALTHTAAFDRNVGFRKGDVIRMALTGSTTPTLDWGISGNISTYTIPTS